MSTQGRWYFFLQNDPHRKADGWYPYDARLSSTVENLWVRSNSFGGNSTPMLPSTASSGYTYSVDFVRMVQRNSVSGKERPIARTTNGLPPAANTAPPVVPAAMAAAPAPSAPSAASWFGFGTSRRSSAFNSSNHRVSSRYSCALHYTAPENLQEMRVDESKVFQNVTAPPTAKPRAKSGGCHGEEKKGGFHDADDECAICMDSLWNNNNNNNASTNNHRVVSIQACQHCFHYGCIREALSKGCGGKCPMCFTPIDKRADGTVSTAKGKCPSGTMSVQNRPEQSCAGHEGYDLLEISYAIQGGTQKKYHPAPDLRFKGACRTAYLPNNSQGQDLLVRMQYAFLHGLTFLVGNSLTSGQANVVTWASIHHKTSRSGGRFAFPDPSYFQRANDEMNDLGVPDPAGCRSWLLSKCPGYS